MSAQPPTVDVGSLPDAHMPDHEGARTRLDLWINKSVRLIAWVAFAAMAISVYEVFMRYGFDSPTSWVHETVVFLIAVLFALGGPAALARDRHIRVRLVYDAAGPRLKYWMHVFNDAATVAFCLAMSYAAYVMFWRSSHDPSGAWSLERSGTSWNPPFPSLTKGIIWFAVLVMLVQSLLHLWQSLRSQRPLHDEVAD